jgi:hypothetical protein
MKSSLRKTIFNPDDKLAEKKEETKEETNKYYLEFIPYEKRHLASQNKFKFDADLKKWYTTDENHPLLNEFKKKVIDFTSFRKQNALFFDPEKKEWYTYSSNEMFKTV